MNSFHCLLVNLGSPKSSQESDVAEFLRCFLMDKYVIQIPRPLRSLLVKSIIIPKRRSRSASRYKMVWGEKLSPMEENMQRLLEKIELKLQDKESDITVSYAMRHGEKSIKSSIKELAASGVKDIFVIPMFPQYEKSTYLSAVEESRKCGVLFGVNTFFIPPFFDHGDYLSALQRSVRDGMRGLIVDKMLFSFHSVPLSYMPCGMKSAKECKSDSECKGERFSCCKACYKYQCYETVRRLCADMGIPEDNREVLFQSQMGHKEWLMPSLSERLVRLAKEGVESVAVLSPSFTVECLETLYDVNIEGRELFLSSGGKEYHYIQSLNSLDLWAKKLAKWIIEAGTKA